MLLVQKNKQCQNGVIVSPDLLFERCRAIEPNTDYLLQQGKKINIPRCQRTHHSQNPHQELYGPGHYGKHCQRFDFDEEKTFSCKGFPLVTTHKTATTLSYKTITI